jgi:hypothetical protein
MYLQVILNKPSPEHKVEDQEFEPNEVYAIDIVVSSGEHKQRQQQQQQAQSCMLSKSLSAQVGTTGSSSSSSHRGVRC